MSTLLLACIATALVLFGPSPPTPPQYADYMKERAAMLAAEEAEWLGGGAASLTAEELKADAVLGAARAADQSSRSSNGLAPIPAVHFFEAKKWFEDMSTVMPLLKAMPKGAALH
eukprot:gene25257-12003_t